MMRVGGCYDSSRIDGLAVTIQKNPVLLKSITIIANAMIPIVRSQGNL